MRSEPVESREKITPHVLTFGKLLLGNDVVRIEGRS